MTTIITFPGTADTTAAQLAELRDLTGKSLVRALIALEIGDYRRGIELTMGAHTGFVELDRNKP
jgi:hypothetical protein